ncbi:hypothetical protein HDU97_005449 [Phlyctochytrium planicorne]|nr:hypothetical protein HDU97_005449 [Phlyctochytrium planicorne]
MRFLRAIVLCAVMVAYCVSAANVPTEDSSLARRAADGTSSSAYARDGNEAKTDLEARAFGFGRGGRRFGRRPQRRPSSRPPRRGGFGFPEIGVDIPLPFPGQNTPPPEEFPPEEQAVEEVPPAVEPPIPGAPPGVPATTRRHFGRVSRRPIRRPVRRLVRSPVRRPVRRPVRMPVGKPPKRPTAGSNTPPAPPPSPQTGGTGGSFPFPEIGIDIPEPPVLEVPIQDITVENPVPVDGGVEDPAPVDPVDSGVIEPTPGDGGVENPAPTGAVIELPNEIPNVGVPLPPIVSRAAPALNA